MGNLKLDKNLDNNLKIVKIDGIASSLEISESKVKMQELEINGDLTINGNLKGALISEGDLNLESGGAFNLTTSSSAVTNDITLNTGGRDLKIVNDAEDICAFSNGGAIVPTFILYAYNGTTDSYFQISSSGTEGSTTISTVDADSDVAHLLIDPDGDLNITPRSDVNINLASGGEFILQENSGTYTPTADTHVATKKYVDDNSGAGDMTGVDLTGGTGISIDSETNTTSGDYSSTITCNLEGTEVVSTGETGGTKFLREDGDNSSSWQPIFQFLMWVGEMARNTGSAGVHRMIPTTYDSTNLTNGNSTDPDTSYTLTNTADHLNNRIVVFPDDITVVECKWSIGEGASTNTVHNFHLMRYDIDADGDLSSGVVVSAGVNLVSDDYSQLRILNTNLSGTASELNVAGDNSQVLIAFIESVTATNTYDSCKVYLKYIWA